MTNLKKILALVLVLAMTFTMLPVFAAAEETAAVETVAPAAAEPAAEAAPAAAAPVAVEDVAPVAAEEPAPAPAPVAEAIETAPTEAVAPVKAELQAAVTSSSLAKVVYITGDLADTEAGFTGIATACENAAQYDGLCEVVVLKDLTFYNASASYYQGALSGKVMDKAGSAPSAVTPVNYDLDNNTDLTAYNSWYNDTVNSYAGVSNTAPGVSVKGFWINLNGHTVTVHCKPGANATENKNYKPMFQTYDMPLNVKNGTLVYKYNRTNVTYQVCPVISGFGTSAGNNAPLDDGTDLHIPSITLKNVNIYRVDGTTYSPTIGPIINVAMLGSDIKIIDSKLISEGAQAIGYTKNIYDSDVPAGVTSAEHNVYIRNSTIGSTNPEKGAFYTTAINSGANVPSTLNVTLDGTVKFLGDVDPFVDCNANGPTVNCSAPAPTVSTTTERIPDKTTLATSNGYSVPTMGDEVIYDCRTYTIVNPDTCPHTAKEDFAAQDPTFAATGNYAYWYCPTCGRYWEADGTTVTTSDLLSIPTLEPEDAAVMTDDELVQKDAVVKTVVVSTGATEKAYTDIRDGYTEAMTWTNADRKLVLLKDITIADSVNNGSNGWIIPNAPEYDNTQVSGMSTKGFWFDLGGHTIDATLGRPLFLSNASSVINVMDGTILFTGHGRYTGTNSKAGMYGIFGFGTSSVSPLLGQVSDIRDDPDSLPLRTASLNLYNMKCYALGTVDNLTAPSIAYSYIANTEINAKDCTLISTNDEQPTFEFSRPKPASTVANFDATYTVQNTEFVATGENFIVNAMGDSVIGTVSTNPASDVATIGIGSADNTTNQPLMDGVAYRLTVTADPTVTFLGNQFIYYTSAGRAVFEAQTTKPDRIETTLSYAFPDIPLASAPYTAWVDPVVYATEVAPGLTTAGSEKATLTTGGKTAYFDSAANAFDCAEKVGEYLNDVTVQLNDDVTSTYAIGEAGKTIAFALDLNGQTVPAAGLFAIEGGVGTQIDITMVGAGNEKLFAGIPEQTYANGDDFFVNRGAFISNYSLNLEDKVTINVYTDVEDPTAIYYDLDGTQQTISAHDDSGAWVIDTLKAKQMDKELDVFAVKKTGTTTTIDFRNGVSVMGYAASNPAAYVDPNHTWTDEKRTAVADALNDAIDTMKIYGKFAEKYFHDDFSDLTGDDKDDIGITDIPVTDVTTGITYADRSFTDSMADCTTDLAADSGFCGTSAILQDSIKIRFYFTGDEFATAAATVNGDPVAVGTKDSFKYVEKAVAAKDFDSAITVAFEGIGSVTDSISSYCKRVAESTDANVNKAAKLANALLAYCADAMRYDAAKNS